MKAVRTAPRIRIDQCRQQVVLAEEPVERTLGLQRPLLAGIGAVCGKAGGNRCGRLHRLLIERLRLAANLAEAPGADGPEVPGRGGLKRHQPPKRPQSGLGVGRRMGLHPGLDESLRQARIVVSKNVFKPQPIAALACVKQAQQPVSQQLSHVAGDNVSRLQRAIGVQTQKRKGPGARR